MESTKKKTFVPDYQSLSGSNNQAFVMEENISEVDNCNSHVVQIEKRPKKLVHFSDGTLEENDDGENMKKVLKN